MREIAKHVRFNNREQYYIQQYLESFNGVQSNQNTENCTLVASSSRNYFTTQ